MLLCLLREIADTTKTEVNSVVAAVVNLNQENDPNFTAIVAVPRFQMALRSITTSSRCAFGSVLQNLNQKDFSRTRTTFRQ